jgi:hypothetical protein
MERLAKPSRSMQNKSNDAPKLKPVMPYRNKEKDVAKVVMVDRT